jgi:hypothetical protein
MSKLRNSAANQLTALMPTAALLKPPAQHFIGTSAPRQTIRGE